MREQAKKAYSGGMTQGSRKRLSKAVTIMSQAIKPVWITNPVTQRLQYHKFAFITLTVASSKNITAREAYDSLLSHFLDWMTRTVGKDNPAAKTYIWKAELQTRGQIHYHITTPAFIHYQDIRDKWNELQRKAGLLDDYAKKNGHFDPNSTDIHDTRGVKHIDRYMIKELGKTIAGVQLKAISEVNKMVENGELSPALAEEKVKEIYAEKIVTIGKVWGCSEDLSGVGYFTLEVTRAHHLMIDEWVAAGKARKFTEDFFSIVYCDDVDPPDLLSPGERNSFNSYLKFAMTRAAPIEAVPAVCVQMDQVDVTKEYTWKELQLNFN